MAVIFIIQRLIEKWKGKDVEPSEKLLPTIGHRYRKATTFGGRWKKPYQKVFIAICITLSDVSVMTVILSIGLFLFVMFGCEWFNLECK